jgi:hypothetical protein
MSLPSLGRPASRAGHVPGASTRSSARLATVARCRSQDTASEEAVPRFAGHAALSAIAAAALVSNSRAASRRHGASPDAAAPHPGNATMQCR